MPAAATKAQICFAHPVLPNDTVGAILPHRVCRNSDRDDAAAIFLPPGFRYTTCGHFTMDLKYPEDGVRMAEFAFPIDQLIAWE